jgi:hypothetical protein
MKHRARRPAAIVAARYNLTAFPAAPEKPRKSVTMPFHPPLKPFIIEGLGSFCQVSRNIDACFFTEMLSPNMTFGRFIPETGLMW